MHTFHALSFVFGAVVSAIVILSFQFGKEKGKQEILDEYEEVE